MAGTLSPRQRDAEPNLGTRTAPAQLSPLTPAKAIASNQRAFGCRESKLSKLGARFHGEDLKCLSSLQACLHILV